MSLGNSYNNNQNRNTVYDPTVYSPYRMNNAESKVDSTCITYSYWRNSLKIGIAPKKNTGNDQATFDMENAIYIYLNHTKARIFADIMKRFKENPEVYTNSGVHSGKGIITVSNGKEYNSDTPVISIRSVDPDTGKVNSEYVYQFKTDYHFAIKGYNAESGDFERMISEYSDLEMDQLITLLEEYYKAMTYAIAYTVLDSFKYEHDRQSKKIDKIAEKLGIDLSSGKGSYNSTSYFANNGKQNSSSGGATYESATLEDIG